MSWHEGDKVSTGVSDSKRLRKLSYQSRKNGIFGSWRKGTMDWETAYFTASFKESPKMSVKSLPSFPPSPFLFAISHGIRREHLDILHHVKNMYQKIKCTYRPMRDRELQEIFWLRFYSLKYQVKCDIVLIFFFFFCPRRLPLFYTQAWLL